MTTKAWRACARVIVLNENTILLCEKVHGDGSVSYVFPGGGVEEGDTLTETAIKETLEETGVKIKSVKPLGFRAQYEFKFWDPEWQKKYKGCDDTFLIGWFSKIERTLDGSYGDEMRYSFHKIEEAINLIQENKPSPRKDVFLKALQIVKRKEKLS